MPYTDIAIDCSDCNEPFVWTSGEQQFFADKNLQNPPKRCKPCKQSKNDRLAVIAANPAEKVEHHTNCASCGKSCTVPFIPRQGRPVYCRKCFNGAE